MSATRNAETVEEAAARLRELVEWGQHGEATDLVVDGRPVARIIAVAESPLDRSKAFEAMRKNREQFQAEGYFSRWTSCSRSVMKAESDCGSGLRCRSGDEHAR